MDLLDKIGRKISQTSQDVAQKTKNMAETMRLNTMISDEEKNINKAFHQIGTLYFETYGENPDQLFVQLIDSINDSKAKIDLYSEQVSKIKGSGAPANTTSEPEAAPVENEASCGECGPALTPEALYCAYCGSKIEVASEHPATPVTED
ncbi:MAG: hypothetical protein FWG14_04580 [Peptococcaceae bacterium]|nr:hypothetical protein [Peptococcaceae bacterium]